MPRENPQPAGPHLILYDGVCGLCNRLNAFVLKHDKNARFRFASLQSAIGQSCLRQFHRNPADLDTFYVIANYASSSALPIERARAALFVLKTLGSPWSWAGILGILPDSLLNFAYDSIARNRYRIFGRYDQCLMPSAENRERFIDI
jgi:predicted DCC family thiol-disulfide oxidoreductase YuxK